jgi:hypothetical protein
MPPSPTKAREMLRHGSVHGKPLTKRQRGLFGAMASGSAKKPPATSASYALDGLKRARRT